MAFVMEPQEESNWCWAAVAASVKHFFSAASTITQCKIATPVLKREQKIPAGTACCVTPDTCDFPAKLQDAFHLRTTNNLRNTLADPLPFDGVQSVKHEIWHALPIAARIVKPDRVLLQPYRSNQ